MARRLSLQGAELAGSLNIGVPYCTLKLLRTCTTACRQTGAPDGLNWLEH